MSTVKPEEKEENADLLKKKEEQRIKVKNNGSETDGLNLWTTPPLMVRRNTTAKHLGLAKKNN